jgi:hypothetical protein
MNAGVGRSSNKYYRTVILTARTAGFCMNITER